MPQFYDFVPKRSDRTAAVMCNEVKENRLGDNNRYARVGRCGDLNCAVVSMF